MLLSQRFALATNAILSRQNGHYLYALGGVERNAAWETRIKTSLEKWWGINNAAECREMIRWLFEEGHSVHFEQAVAEVWALANRNGGNLDLQSLASNEQQVAAYFAQEVGPRALVAWDAGRLVNVAGWGYIAGYFEEREAWQYIVTVAATVQRIYASWAEYGRQYMIGRAFWGGHDPEIEKTINALLREEDSPWVCIPWNTELTVPGVQASIGPYWSRILQSCPGQPALTGEPPRVERQAYPSGARIVRHVDGADLVEADGRQEWHDCHNLSITRDRLRDDWGPVQRDLSRLEGVFSTLEQMLLHNETFTKLEKQDALAAEKAVVDMGYRSVGHFYRVQATGIKHYATPTGAWVRQAVYDSQDYNHAVRTVFARMQQIEQQQILGASPHLTAPIMGISLETYALLSAKQAAGMPDHAFNALLAQHQIDLAGYQTVAQGWVARFQQDPAGKLAQRYGQLYMQNASGQYGAAGQASATASAAGVAATGAEPVPFEKYCEITGAMIAWGEQGVDSNTELPRVFGMSMIDYGNIASFWGTRLQTRMNEYSRLVEKFTKQHGGGAAAQTDDDLDQD